MQGETSPAPPEAIAEHLVRVSLIDMIRSTEVVPIEEPLPDTSAVDRERRRHACRGVSRSVLGVVFVAFSGRAGTARG